METTTTQPVSRRLPISCEPCRKRKIKCPRDRRPCQTCLRRGLHADECVYLGRPRLSSEQTSGTDASVQKELLERIRNLEDLLQRQIGAHPSPQRSDPESPSVTVTSSTRTISDLDRAGEASTISRFEAPGNAGSLQVSATGHVRYVPLASQWNSVLANNSAGGSSEKLESSGADQEDMALPFNCNGPMSTRDLLALLPPARYCDVLKDVYFRVFSPVSNSHENGVKRKELRNRQILYNSFGL
jgi:Fungal Zn(2)-Cys(6) binuclear cluster domain